LNDIIIHGGGIVGLTTAIAIAKYSNLNILVLEAANNYPNWDPEKIDARVSAISPGSKKIFASLNVWDKISAKRISPYLNMHVWDQSGNGAIDFNCQTSNTKTLGYIIENSVIHQSLVETAENNSQIKIIPDSKTIELNISKDHLEIKLQDEAIFKTKLLIGADGAKSWVRTQANISLTEKNYNHTAIVATVQTEKSHQQTAWQCFSKNGPLAFLPLKDPHQCSIVWSMPPELAEKLMQLSNSDFAMQLNLIFSEKLGSTKLITERATFPLKKQHAKNYIQSGIALVGDAAHTIHPLLGQGMNQGLLDAITLSKVIAEADKQQRDFSAKYTLRTYERSRKSSNQIILTAADFFKNIFASPNKFTEISRNFGLQKINQINFIKKFLADYALGDIN